LIPDRTTGLGVLVGGLKRLRAGDGQLLPGRRHYNVARLLHITGLNKVLPLYPEGASALEL